MKKSIVLCAVMLLAASAVSAQQFEFSSSLNPVGSGARATGMGGAFIGVADDATAASWNPAGLIQLERPEVSAVFARFTREQSYSSASHPEVNTTNSMNDNGINYLSAVFKPFVLFDHNVVVSVNYQRLYEMEKQVSFVYNVGVNPFTIDMQQSGYLYAFSPALAFQVNPSFSLGATFNFWKDYLGANGWSQIVHLNSAALAFDAHEQKTVGFDGFNMNLGFLWNATSSITVGGVIKTPFDADLKVTTMTTALTGTTPQQADFSQTTSKMSMPMSYGVGVQYRPSDTIVLALDVYQTAWSDFMVTTAGGKVNPIDGSTNSLKDTTQVRLGAEYLMIGKSGTTALRCGLFSDPEPSVGKTDDYTGFTLGAGYATKQYSFDASYQYRSGKDITSDLPALPDNKMDVTQQTIMASIIWYF